MADEEGGEISQSGWRGIIIQIKNNPVYSTYTDISDNVRGKVSEISSWSHSLVEGQATRFYRTIFRSPGPIVIVMILLALLVGKDAMNFGQQINGDVEIYLPDGADSTELLLDVREQWSTDIVLLYIHTDNSIDDPTHRGSENITDVDILRQISFLEGDDDNKDMSRYARGIDWNKDDRGTQDGVVWILSAPQMIKEANSAPNRFACSVEKYGLPIQTGEDCTIANQDPRDTYVIPDNQDRVNNTVENLGKSLDNLVVDTNGDGIWDTAVVVMGIRFEMAGADVDTRADPNGKEILDHKSFILHLKSVINDCSLNPDIYNQFDDPLCGRDYEGIKLSSMDDERWEDLPTRQAITVTGLTPVLHDVSDAIYLALEDMLPISLAFVCIAMIALHRNPKVLIICGTPIVLSLAVTFGTTVILDIMLTPMIIAAGPILIGLGVDYALHLINRIEETRENMLEENANLVWEAKRDGEPLPELDPWDKQLYLDATVHSIMTTGHAILLSAITTIVGFSVLAWAWLVPIQPMRTVGITLVLGISCTFFFSIILVPSLGWLVRYRKTGGKNAEKIWAKIGEVPVKGAWIVIAFALIISSGGALMLGKELGADITAGSNEVPPDLESYETLAEYSSVFEGGQTNMFIIDAEARGVRDDIAPIRHLEVLDSIEYIQEEKIDNVANTSSISLVTLLKAIHINVNLSGQEMYDRSLWEILHSPCWEDQFQPECIITGDFVITSVTTREVMINIAFDTLSYEIRSMLMNEPMSNLGETKTLVYVNQPYLNLALAGELRDQLDAYLSEGGCDDALNCNALGVDSVKNSLLTGGLPVSLDINKGIHNAQSDATIATMIVLLFAMTLLFRSPRLAFFTMTSVAVVVLWQPLLMYTGDVNVNVFTAMISTIVFGIGVDDSIHVMDRIREENETPGGIVKAVARTGQTIFETTATTCAGLAAGLTLAIPGLRNFFTLMMLLIFLALLTSAILLPAMIVAYRTIESAIKGEENWQDYEEDAHIVSGAMDAELTS
jgi:predicted RND superfamily exporter protein